MVYTVAEMRYSTVTLGASGNANATNVGHIYPARSNAQFKNLSILVVPVETNSPYKVEVFYDTKLMEEHDFPDTTEKYVAEIGFPNFVFPANISLNSVPRFHTPNNAEPTGMGIKVQITNETVGQRVFEVYTCFETFEHNRFSIVTQEEK